MIKEFLQRLGLLRPTTTDEHIEYAGDNISLQRKNYPHKQLTPLEEYDLYSDITWEKTVCFMKDDTTIEKSDITMQEAIKLLQDDYTAIPF